MSYPAAKPGLPASSPVAYVSAAAEAAASSFFAASAAALAGCLNAAARLRRPPVRRSRM